MGYLQLAAVAGLGSSGVGLSASPLAPIMMGLALCAFGYALSLLLRGRGDEAKKHEPAPAPLEPEPVEEEA